jgi:hypothetical protein
MPTYVEVLTEDRKRVRKALQSLIADQERKVAELRATLAEHAEALDQHVLRTMIFRYTFGPGQTDTLSAEIEAQEASRPVTEETVQLERELEILRAFRSALEQIDAGKPFNELSRASTPLDTGADGKSWPLPD